ncbi:hypothetical protein Tco_0532793 [Tanacetum coccineum]
MSPIPDEPANTIYSSSTWASSESVVLSMNWVGGAADTGYGFDEAVSTSLLLTDVEGKPMPKLPSLADLIMKLISLSFLATTEFLNAIFAKQSI